METRKGLEFCVPFGERVTFDAVPRIHCGNHVLIDSKRDKTISDRESKQT